MYIHTHKLASASALVLAVATFSAFADSASPTPSTAKSNAATAAVAHKAPITYINSGSSGGSALNPGFNNVDAATTINCPAAAGCTIGVRSMVQIAPPAGTNWAICPVVDGLSMSPPCPYQGLLPSTSSFVTGNGLSNFAVAKGPHTVQLQVYVDQTSGLYNWEVDYTLYKP